MIAFDGSHSADRALELAKTHAKAFEDSEVFVVTSLEGDTQEQLHRLEKAEQDLSRAKLFFNDEKIKCETELLSQGVSPGEALVEYATDKGIDEIIIGIQKKSKVGKFLFGSTAQYVILQAPCPVLTTH
jgi:nucleotide-binding universal stress UspA family protein